EGRAGFTPQLSLNYGSDNPDGIAGVGWGLGGLSYMARCPEIKAAHGAPERIRFTHDDAYCLDGQRLVLVEGTVGTQSARYRMEIDSGVVVSPVEFGPNGPTNWEVLTPNGRQAFYRVPDGQVVSRRRHDDAGQSHFVEEATLIWPIHTQYDGLGNRISYDFAMEGAVPLPLT